MVYNVAVNPVGDFNQHYHRAPLAMKNTSSARVRFYVSNGGGRSSLVDTAVVAVQSQNVPHSVDPRKPVAASMPALLTPFLFLSTCCELPVSAGFPSDSPTSVSIGSSGACVT